MVTPVAYTYINKDTNPDRLARLWPGCEVKEGLEAVGYVNRCKYMVQAKNEIVYPWDLLISWTLWSRCQRSIAADLHTKIGGKVLCSENGFIKTIHGIPYYQLAERVGYGSGINGQGKFPAGDDSRWKSWNISLKPWRTEGSHILLCAQRGMRPEDPLITHGPDWPDEVITKIRKYTDRPIWYRPHPGNRRPCLPQKHKVERIIEPHKESLTENLMGAWCTVVYTSTSATDSLLQGVPVCYDGPMIMAHALAGKVNTIENPVIRDREEVLSHLAWGQWSGAELQSGQAFRHILGLE